MSDLKEDLKQVLVDLNFSAAGREVSHEDDLFEAGALDSLTLIQYILALEKKFKIRIANTDITYENFKSFSFMAEFLSSKYIKSA